MHDFGLILPLLLVIFLGVLCARFKFFSEADNASIIKLVFYIIIPVLIFTNLVNTDAQKVFHWPYILSYLIASLFLMILIGLIAKYYFKRSSKEIILNLMSGTHTNSVYLALPLFLMLFDDTIPVISIIVLQNLINLAIISTLEITDYKNQANIFELCKNIFIKNPLIIASFAGIILSLLQIKLPFVINNTLEFISKPGEFLALFALGLSLILDNQPINKKDSLDAGLLVVSKNFLHPLIGFLLGYYIFHLDNYWLIALVIMCIMPTAKNVFIFSKKYQVNSYKYNWIVMSSTIISLLLLNVVIVVFRV